MRWIDVKTVGLMLGTMLLLAAGAWALLQDLEKRGDDLAAVQTGALLEETGVATVPGAAFGLSPALRISYATDDKTLERGLNVLVELAQN